MPSKKKAVAFETDAGQPHPVGSTVQPGGVNFSIFSRHATGVDLLLFDSHDAPEPIQVISLDPTVNHTFLFWHVFVKGLPPGTHYGYRVSGPDDLHGRGFRFNPNKVLIDPYARGNTTTLWDRGAACNPDDNVATSMRSTVMELTGYDWEGDAPCNRPMNESIVYEMHVGGFTKSPNSGVAHPGTFQGIVEKIPYLKELGITAVELLPVMEFDACENSRTGPDGTQLTNFWGYSTIGFMAPNAAYCMTPEQGEHLNEFRDMVKALHQADIEIILDIVFNHTSEGNHQGPVISFKGFDNSTYYFTVPSDRQYYMDYSGCGNTLDCNHPIVDKFILDTLEFWVSEMHVDGFRFDEGSILSRGEDGSPMHHPPVLWNTELSEVLAHTKVIAEAWDAAGLYQVGYFPGFRWAEWNGRYRDDIRRFVRGDPGLVGAAATRIAGSADIYQPGGRLPINSINFIDCHDGFTLADIVSYNEKHNWANGEGNRDGNDNNMSWNCGAEGPTTEPAVLALRQRQLKNFAAILMLSQGVPMIVAGDEFGRTQRGNNNAYCQDNELSWVDWSMLDSNRELYTFFKGMIAFRQAHASLRRKGYFTGAVNDRGLADISWHGCQLFAPGWNDPASQVLAFTLGGFNGGNDLHVMLNMSANDLEF
ncbi:MAG TPA: glycogen debranching protein GlgX, partial [Actinomycetota bacterium]|nr:glycogen debranching protein GlgX [Actinomycetota bacterium]